MGAHPSPLNLPDAGHALRHGLAYYLILILAVVGIAYLIRRALLPKPFRGIPHRPGSADRLLGDLPDFAGEVLKTHDWNTWLLAQVRELNAPLIQLFVAPFSRPVLFLSDFRETQDILLRRSNEFDRHRFTAEVFAGILPNFHIHLKTGPEWKAHRKLLQDLMTPSFLHNVAAPSIYHSTQRLIDLWTIKTGLAQDKPFEAGTDINFAALDAVLSFSFGSALPSSALQPQVELLRHVSRSQLETPSTSHDQVQNHVIFPRAPIDEGIEAMYALGEAVEEIKASTMPRLKWKFITRLPRLAKATRAKNNLVIEQLKLAKKALESSGDSKEDADWVRSAVHYMGYRETKLAEREGRQPQFFSPVMKDEVYGFVVAGHDTTSTAVSWGVKFLSDNSEVQQTLRSRLLDAFPDAKSEQRTPSLAEILHANVPYLDAVLEEILRCALVVPVLGREAKYDTTILGHAIPKGTVVFMSTAGPSFLAPPMHVDERTRSKSSQANGEQAQHRVWNPDDMATFVPSRWLVSSTVQQQQAIEGGQNLDEKQVITEQNEVFESSAGPSLPFGAGPRGCYGRRLAYLEMRLLFVLILWKFELQSLPKELAGYEAFEGIVHKPKHCFLRLKLTELGALL